MIHIKHQNPNDRDFRKCTIVLETISKGCLENMFKNGINDLGLNLGVTFLHPKDQYNKKTGVKKAIHRIQHVETNLLNIEIRNKNRVVFCFKAFINDPKNFSKDWDGIVENQVCVHFGVSFVPESNNTRLEYAFVD